MRTYALDRHRPAKGLPCKRVSRAAARTKESPEPTSDHSPTASVVIKAHQTTKHDTNGVPVRQGSSSTRNGHDTPPAQARRARPISSPSQSVIHHALHRQCNECTSEATPPLWPDVLRSTCRRGGLLPLPVCLPVRSRALPPGLPREDDHARRWQHRTLPARRAGGAAASPAAPATRSPRRPDPRSPVPPRACRTGARPVPAPAAVPMGNGAAPRATVGVHRLIEQPTDSNAVRARERRAPAREEIGSVQTSTERAGAHVPNRLFPPGGLTS